MTATRRSKPAPGEDDAREFLRLLYGETPPGYLAIWTKQNKTTEWIEAKDIDAAALKAAQQAKTFDCFFGIGLQPKPLGRKKRGEAATVSAIPGLWFDLDIKGLAHAQKDLPESLDAVLTFVQDLPLFELVIADELLEASAIGSVAIVLTLTLVFLASRLLGKGMADLFR
jgi:hypothetical protein